LCGHCGFSAAYLRAHLGEQWVRIERVTDAAHCLRLEELRSCEVALDDFERSFPQSFLAVYLGALPAGLNVTELGFWLLNQGAFNTHLMMKRNDFGIVLVIDPVAKIVGLTLGYGIEPVFVEEQQNKLLKAVVKQLAKGRHSRAILDAVTAAGSILRRAGVRQSWEPQTSPDGTGIEFQPLRSGHQFTDGRENGTHSSRPGRIKPLAPMQ
jgi:uncharacterized membrane protein YgcG